MKVSKPERRKKFTICSSSEETETDSVLKEGKELLETESEENESNDESDIDKSQLEESDPLKITNKIPMETEEVNRSENDGQFDRIMDPSNGHVPLENDDNDSSTTRMELVLDTPGCSKNVILERFLSDIRNFTGDELKIINSPYVQKKDETEETRSKTEFKQKPNGIKLSKKVQQKELNFPVTKYGKYLKKNSNEETADSEKDNKVQTNAVKEEYKQKHGYAFYKNKKKHRRMHYDRYTLKQLFKYFSKYIEKNRLPLKSKIEKYIYKISDSEVLQKAGTENVYYVLKNKIRKENS